MNNPALPHIAGRITESPPDVLDIAGLGMHYGDTTAIKDVSFKVPEGEFVSVVGPSGCGKTTLLKCIAGLLSPSKGMALFQGKRIESPPPQMALVFQDYARSLYPWLTVRANVALPLRKKHSALEVNDLVEESLVAVGLAGFMDHFPWQLSGGMQQRVAIARAIAYTPKVLLLDEPFASVDAQTRADLEDLILELREKLKITMLLVTHDIDEAVYMSERIVILTKHPSVVQEVLRVNLPWPRNQIETKAEPEFLELRGHLYGAIRQAHSR